jgi:(2R)-ethylmalonyl-CoA mutase
MKTSLVGANAARVRAIETGELTVVGVNRWTDSEASPLSAGEGMIETVDARLESGVVQKLKAWRATRDPAAVAAAMAALAEAARSGANIMPPSIACAKAGVTTGEWADALRAEFGEYRGPTGVGVVMLTGAEDNLDAVRAAVDRVSDALGRRLTLLVGKPGLDGHSNGAEQIATRARAVGMEAVYDGIRSTPAEIVARARDSQAHVIGLSILSGSHLDLVQEVVRLLRAEGLEHIPVVVGGIVPPEDALVLKQMGVTRVYTPKDFQLTAIMADLVRVAEAAALTEAV